MDMGECGKHKMAGWAEKSFSKLTLEQKVGQVICYRAGNYHKETLEMAKKGFVGCLAPSFYYSGFVKNSNKLAVLMDNYSGFPKDPDKLIAFMNKLQETSPIPILFMDARANESFKSWASPFPGENSMMTLGAARNAELAYKFGKMTAREAKVVGLNLLWEPCVDVNTNPNNPIIGSRSISDNPELVTEIAMSFVLGVQNEKVIPNAKHFPGHGDQDCDTHVKLGIISHGRKRLEEVEFFPYRYLIKNNLRGIMTGHLIYPAIDPTPGLPATFSRKCIYELLRKEMGYGGLIVSDSLTMKAIRDNFTVEDAAIRTFNAGHDIILHDYKEPPHPTFEALLKAVKRNIIPMAELDASVMRILRAKEWCGLPARRLIAKKTIEKNLNIPEHRKLAQEIFESSVTVLENDGMPLHLGNRHKIFIVGTKSPEEGKELIDFGGIILNSRDTFFTELKKRLCGITTHILDEDPSEKEVGEIISASKGFSVVIFGTFPRIMAYKKLSGQVGRGQIKLVQKLQSSGKKLILCVFGNPYVISNFPKTSVCLTTYSHEIGAVKAGVKVLFGEIKAKGKLPVTIPNRYEFGYGL